MGMVIYFVWLRFVNFLSFDAIRELSNSNERKSLQLLIAERAMYDLMHKLDTQEAKDLVEKTNREIQELYVRREP